MAGQLDWASERETTLDSLCWVIPRAMIGQKYNDANEYSHW